MVDKGIKDGTSDGEFDIPLSTVYQRINFNLNQYVLKPIEPSSRQEQHNRGVTTFITMKSWLQVASKVAGHMRENLKFIPPLAAKLSNPTITNNQDNDIKTSNLFITKPETTREHNWAHIVRRNQNRKLNYFPPMANGKVILPLGTAEKGKARWNTTLIKIFW